MITTRGLSKKYQDTLVVDDVSINISKGGLTSIIGPNGAGKSTLLSMISRLTPMSAGSVEIDGLDVTRTPGPELAQRLSILHGLNAPEFFDKSLFRHFIQTLINEGVVQTDTAGKLSYHEKLGSLAESAAKRVLPAEIRLSIRQVTDDEDEAL